MSKEIPQIFNWVKARSECSLERVFLLFSEVLESDVKTMQGLARSGVLYEQTRGERKVVVCRTRDCGGGIKEAEGVVFELVDGAITATAKDARGNGTQLFKAKPSLEPNGACKLEVDGEGLELWQVSRKALEPLFF